MSDVTCHVSHVTCHLPPDMFHLSTDTSRLTLATLKSLTVQKLYAQKNVSHVTCHLPPVVCLCHTNYRTKVYFPAKTKTIRHSGVTSTIPIYGSKDQITCQDKWLPFSRGRVQNVGGGMGAVRLKLIL